jgi:hypothetical protein
LIAIQVVLIILCFNIFRKPWKGTVLKLEQAEMVQEEKLFEEISSFHNATDLNESLLGPDTIVGLRNPEKVTEQEKREALKKTYEDPFVDLMQIMQQQIEEWTEPQPQY